MTNLITLFAQAVTSKAPASAGGLSAWLKWFLLLSIPSTALVVVFKDLITKAIAAPFRWLAKAFGWTAGKVSVRVADWSLEQEYLFRITFKERHVKFVGERGDADYSRNLELPAVFIPLRSKARRHSRHLEPFPGAGVRGEPSLAERLGTGDISFP